MLKHRHDWNPSHDGECLTVHVWSKLKPTFLRQDEIQLSPCQCLTSKDLRKSGTSEAHALCEIWNTVTPALSVSPLCWNITKALTLHKLQGFIPAKQQLVFLMRSSFPFEVTLISLLQWVIKWLRYLLVVTNFRKVCRCCCRAAVMFEGDWLLQHFSLGFSCMSQNSSLPGVS